MVPVPTTCTMRLMVSSTRRASISDRVRELQGSLLRLDDVRAPFRLLRRWLPGTAAFAADGVCVLTDVIPAGVLDKAAAAGAIRAGPKKMTQNEPNSGEFTPNFD